MSEIICDIHAHSNLSDGSDTPEEMLAEAARKGLKVFALTDHFDMEREAGHVMRGAGTESAYEKLIKVRESNNTPVKFIAGIEVGQAHRYIGEARERLGKRQYDYILCSCHSIRGKDDFYYLRNREDVDFDELFRQYLSELLEICEVGDEFGGFDSLAHLTYPLRYIKGISNMSFFKKEIDEIFRVMIKKNIALEINGQAINHEYGRLTPELPETARYRELGGRLITVGSDCHSTKLIGSGIAECIAAAKSAGFAEYAYYEKREAKFIKI